MTLGPFERLEGTANKGGATNLQRVLMPWLISKNGLSCKSARMEVVKQMVEAIFDRDNLLDLGEPCRKVISLMQSASIRLLERPKLQEVCTCFHIASELPCSDSCAPQTGV